MSGIPYNIIRSNATPVASTDFLTLISAATRSFYINEIDAEGAGTTSAYMEIGIYRVTTAGATGGGAIVPAPLNAAAPASGVVVNTTWTTQPAPGTLMHNIPINANGQRYFWRAEPNKGNALTSSGGANAAGSLSVRPITVSGPVTMRLQIVEL